MKILIVRNDKIGDFMLAWPGFAMLKTALPESSVYALVPDYTKPLAKICPWIDDIIIDPGPAGGDKGLRHLIDEVAQHRFDALITLFSTTRVGWLGWRAKIPYRLAPATKFAQVFYNDRLTQRRSKSLKPEYEYNLDLIRYFLHKNKIKPLEPEPPYLTFPSDDLQMLKKHFYENHKITPRKKLFFIHAGSGGSANNLSLEQYTELAEKLADDNRIFILTGGPGEEQIVERLSRFLFDKKIDHRRYLSTEGIVTFAKHLALADLFIAGSTGPLHIAGALDVPTVAFYPGKRSSTPLRWQTLNSHGRRIAFNPPPGEKTETDMSLINIDQVAPQVINFIIQFR